MDDDARHPARRASVRPGHRARHEEQAEYLERKDVPLEVVVGRSLNLMRLLEDEVSHGAEVHVVRGGLGRRVELWWAQ